MATQPAPARPWFRLPSIARPAASAPTPVPEPPPPQPRPALARPAFRPLAQPTQPQEPTPAPASTLPQAAGGGGVASVPSSPIQRASAPSSSLPTSPAPAITTGSVPSSPIQPRASPPTSSLPTSPLTKPLTNAIASSSSVPASPAPKPTLSSTVTSPAAKRSPTGPTTPATATIVGAVEQPAVLPPAPSPIAKKTPPLPAKPKPTTPPPSPLTLPPAQIVKSDADSEPKIPLEAEQKTVVVQKTIDKPSMPPHIGSSNSDRGGFMENLKSSLAQLKMQEKEKSHYTKKSSSDSEEVGMRMITIAGENRGAFMEVIHSPNKKAFEGTSHKWGSHSSSRSSSDEEGKHRKKDKTHKGKSNTSRPMSAFMNSNVQGVNNSIVFKSSCTHHDPGLHLSLSRKPGGGGGFDVKEHGGNNSGFQG